MHGRTEADDVLSKGYTLVQVRESGGPNPKRGANNRLHDGDQTRTVDIH